MIEKTKLQISIEEWTKKHKGTTLSRYNIDELMRIVEQNQNDKKSFDEAKERYRICQGD